MGEQRPFDTVSLMYLLPLAMAVLQTNGIGWTEPDEVDEQITLALEFLTLHTDSCECCNPTRGPARLNNS